MSKLKKILGNKTMDNENWYRMTLRIPPNLEKNLRESINENGKSLTGEIIDRLNKSFKIEALSENDFAISVKESAERIASLANKISLISEQAPSLERPTLNKEELKILKFFSQADREEQAILVNSLPELISVFKKMR